MVEKPSLRQRVAPLSFRNTPVPDLVTCVVPVFNNESYVGETLESILNQSYSPIEVIVVDDGSEDASAQIVSEFGARVRLIRQSNQGPSAARNRGMEESRGTFLAFLDSDDLWVKDKTEVQMKRFRRWPELQLCSGHIKSFWIPELDHERQQLEGHPYHAERPMLSPCTVLVKREVFVALGGFDPELRNAEDTDWFLRMMKAGIVYETIPQLLVNRRQHTSNLTRTVRPSLDAMLTQLKRTLDRERAT